MSQNISPTTKITTKVTAKIASLSRLKKDPDQAFLDQYTDQLNNVFAYMQELQEINTDEILATDIIEKIDLEQLREDEPDNNQIKYQQTRKNIINNFPQKQGDFLVLPIRIIE
jgi:aspartyl/glutamyl-tRNA(Asn/Gln) amidotransferase C subunit